jgi:hypothetical protein
MFYFVAILDRSSLTRTLAGFKVLMIKKKQKNARLFAGKERILLMSTARGRRDNPDHSPKERFKPKSDDRGMVGFVWFSCGENTCLNFNFVFCIS